MGRVTRGVAPPIHPSGRLEHVIEQILVADRHLQVDQVEKARDIYARVVELDPGNAIAVVGLARCALAEGEDAQAYELAARALVIDPENEMARRMEARLSEIMATRGESVTRPGIAGSPNPYEMRSVVTQAAPESSSRPGPTAGPPPAPMKEPNVRKSLLDRLLGR